MLLVNFVIIKAQRSFSLHMKFIKIFSNEYCFQFMNQMLAKEKFNVRIMEYTAVIIAIATITSG